MVRLPEKPMMPRLFDERVGYFTTRQQDYTADEYRVRNVQYIARWRLEKKDPSAAVSDPVKPIVYYIDSATPKKWAPWLKKGIEDWNEAFAAAGFSHAIIGKARALTAGRPRFQPRRRALFGDSLAAFNHRKRERTAHFGSAHGRDSQRGHSVLSTT